MNKLLLRWETLANILPILLYHSQRRDFTIYPIFIRTHANINDWICVDNLLPVYIPTHTFLSILTPTPYTHQINKEEAHFSEIIVHISYSVLGFIRCCADVLNGLYLYLSVKCFQWFSGNFDCSSLGLQMVQSNWKCSLANYIYTKWIYFEKPTFQTQTNLAMICRLYPFLSIFSNCILYQADVWFDHFLMLRSLDRS